MKYRREIDGLRAIAVLSVILFHAGIEKFCGGFVGVDVFFVISGYLITTIILAELEQGKFSIVNFYERRARRILPALFLVMLVCIPFAWLLLTPTELSSFSKSLVAVPLFVSNIFFGRHVEYFETEAELKPLLHTWSLAAEEQYYIIYPLFLMLFWRLWKQWILITLGITFLASLTFAQWALYTNLSSSFFLLPTRVWELIIGAFTAFYLSKDNRKEFGANIGEVGGCLGVALILYAVFNFSQETPFPGLYALIPTIGSALIILFATPQTNVGKFLGSKIFVGIGLLSYSAYLWHQPILAYARHCSKDVYLNIHIKLLLIVILFTISFLSWRYVEQPFRIKGKFSRRFILVFSLVGTLFLVLIGYITSNIDFSVEEIMAKDLFNHSIIYSQNCDDRIFVKNRVAFEKMNPEAIAIGSSRLMQASSNGIGLNLLNLSVSGASLEDLIAIWELSSRKFNPDYVFLGTDPWIFNSNSRQSRWMSLGGEYRFALSKLGFDIKIESYKNKNKSIFNYCANKVYKSINIKVNIANDDLPSWQDKIRKDGSRVYNFVYANKSIKDIERGLKKCASYGMANYSYSNEARLIFEKFVSNLKSQNRKVVFVLSPYHPKMNNIMRSEEKKLYCEMESVFRNIAASYDIQVVGSYDPFIVGSGAEDFYDGMHPKDSCMNKVFSEFSR
jgi:peptidoglycan/LPS O-acetylase OafA/YrhL